MSVPPPPWKRGDKIRADRLTAADDARRSNEVAAPAGATVSRGRFGTFVNERPADPAGNALGIITTSCTARTGTSPNFTYGVGQALILRDTGTGTVSTGVTRDVYNSLPVVLAAATGMVQLKLIYGKLFVDVKDCP